MANQNEGHLACLVVPSCVEGSVVDVTVTSIVGETIYCVRTVIVAMEYNTKKQ